jgi:hypothetical protein
MPRRDPAKERYWRRLLRLWRASGLNGRDFCAQQRLSEPSFYAWRRELARRDQQRQAPQAGAAAATPAFVALAVAADPVSPPAIEVVVAERRLLRVRPGFDAELLRQLVRLLEEPSC